MLVKYYGLFYDEKKSSLSPRVDFISNGLFRMTQPKYLNDKGSETRLYPYFNKFSPADYSWAKKEHDKLQTDPHYIPSNEELEIFFLKPTGIRYGDQIPHMLNQEGFKSMEEYDESQIKKLTEGLNNFLVEALSSQLGIFSLSKSETNELMWTHYASNGQGLAVTFNSKHPFFLKFPAKDVNYDADKRASFTYYKGMMRLNGSPLKTFKRTESINILSIMYSLSDDNIDITKLSDCLLYSKAEKWSYENEVRIVCPLSLCEEKHGELIEPHFEGLEMPCNFKNPENYHSINLKKIPFDSFDSIILGYDMSEAHKQIVIDAIKENPDLTHIKVRLAKHDLDPVYPDSFCL